MKSIFAILIMILFFFSPQVRAGEHENVELSLSTMILFAMDNNPDVSMALERENQMGHFVDEAKSGYYPQIQLDAQGGREFIDPTNGPNTNNLVKSSVTLNQKIFDGFTTESEVKRRKELKNSAGLDVVREKEDLILEVTDFYLDVLRYQRVKKTTEKFVTEVDEIVQIIADMYEAGAAGKAMLDYAQSRQASAHVDLNEANSSLNDSISNLEFLTGELPDFQAVLPNSFNPSKIKKNVYIDSMSEKNTLLKKSESELTAMRHQLRLEKGEFYPTLEFVMKAEQSHDDGGDTGRFRDLKGTVNLSYNIFDGFNKRNRVGRVNGQIKELEHRDRKIFKELKRDVNLAYNQTAALKESLKTVKYEIRSNRALQSLNRENFKLGSINVIELIEGEERLNSAYNRKYELQQELYQSIYNLLISTAVIEDNFFCKTCDTITQALR